jgi:hypothetical protein
LRLKIKQPKPVAAALVDLDLVRLLVVVDVEFVDPVMDTIDHFVEYFLRLRLDCLPCGVGMLLCPQNLQRIEDLALGCRDLEFPPKMIRILILSTVKHVSYNDHPWDREKVVVVQRWSPFRRSKS